MTQRLLFLNHTAIGTLYSVRHYRKPVCPTATRAAADDIKFIKGLKEEIRELKYRSQKPYKVWSDDLIDFVIIPSPLEITPDILFTYLDCADNITDYYERKQFCLFIMGIIIAKTIRRIRCGHLDILYFLVKRKYISDSRGNETILLLDIIYRNVL